MKVWLMEEGEYEQRDVHHVIANLEDAPGVLTRHLEQYQAKYGPITVGEVATDDRGRHSIRVTWPGVVSTYDITEWDVETADGR